MKVGDRVIAKIIIRLLNRRIFQRGKRGTIIRLLEEMRSVYVLFDCEAEPCAVSMRSLRLENSSTDISPEF